MPVWLWIAIGVVVVLVVAFAVWFIVVANEPPEKAMEKQDGDDPLKRWARGGYCMVYGSDDPGRLLAASAGHVLSRDWEINTTQEVEETLTALRDLPSGNAAWDLVRAIIVARFAAAAKHISDDQSWSAIASVQNPLQQAYDGWPAMAAAYEQARTAEGFDVSQLEMYRDDAEALWKLIPFK
jgi:hypothetical protein